MALREGEEPCGCDLGWITMRAEKLVGPGSGRWSPRRHPGADMTVPTIVEGPPLPAVTASGFGRRERDRLIRRAKALSWLSLAWMAVEGGVAITAALASGSVALLGFGIDSAIEGIASVIVIWRFTGARRLSEDAERRAQKAVAISVLPARSLRRPGRDPRSDRRRASVDQLGRDRAIGRLDHRDAAPGSC